MSGGSGARDAGHPHLQRMPLSDPAFSLSSPKTGHKVKPSRSKIYGSYWYTRVRLQTRCPTTAFSFYLVRRSKLFPNHIYTFLINQTSWSALRDGGPRQVLSQPSSSTGTVAPPPNRRGETPCRARGSAPALWGTPARAGGPTHVWLEERAHEQRRGAAAGLLRGKTPPPMSARHRKHWRLKVHRKPSGHRCFTLGCGVSLTEGLLPNSHSSPRALMPPLQCHRPTAHTPCPSPHPLPMTVLVT